MAVSQRTDGNLASYYQRPDLKAVLEQIRRSRLRLRLAMSAVSAGRALNELLACWQDYATRKTLSTLLHEQKSSDPQYLLEMAFFRSADGQVRISLALAFKALRDCRFRDEIVSMCQPFNLTLAAQWAEQVNERILDDYELECRLVEELTDWIAQSRIFCLGQRWPMANIMPLLESPQRSIRRATFRGIQDFIKNHEDWLNRRIDELLECRSQMSRKLRLDSFSVFTPRHTGLGGVSLEQVENFSQWIVHYFVPMGVEIRRLQRKRLGLEQLSEHDWLCMLPDGHPVPSVKWEMQFQSINQALTDLLRQQDAKKLLDTTCLDQVIVDFQLGPDMYGEAEAYIVGANGPVYWRLAHHGTMADISQHLQVLGPLLAQVADRSSLPAREVQPAPVLPDIARSTLQACLTEWVALPFLGEILTEMELFRQLRLAQWVEQLVFLTMTAEFSAIIHRDQLQDPEKRYRLWLELERRYLPDLEHDDWSFMAQGGLMHLAYPAWLSPGHSLAQALGLFSALAIWQKDKKSSERLNRDWARLIFQGNQVGFTQLLDHCQIPSPWNEATFKQLAFAICAEMSL